MVRYNIDFETRPKTRHLASSARARAHANPRRVVSTTGSFRRVRAPPQPPRAAVPRARRVRAAAQQPDGFLPLHQRQGLTRQPHDDDGKVSLRLRPLAVGLRRCLSGGPAAPRQRDLAVVHLIEPESDARSISCRPKDRGGLSHAAVPRR